MTEEEKDPRATKEELDKRAGEMLDYSQKLVTVLRNQMKDYEDIIASLDQQKQRALVVYEKIGELLAYAIEHIGDTLLAEFGPLILEDDEDEDEEEDEDG